MANSGAALRKEIPPFLLKLYYRENALHWYVLLNEPSQATKTRTNSLTNASSRPEEFADSRPPPHLQIYTWMDCTLGELTKLLTQALPDIVPEPKVGSRCAYRFIYADTRPAGDRRGGGQYQHKDVGAVVLSAEDDADDDDAAPPAPDDAGLSLAAARFVIGDAVCVTISDGHAAPPPARPPRRASAFDRDRSDPAGYGRLADRDYAEPPPRRSARENGFHPYERAGGRRGGGGGAPRYPDIARSQVPHGEWRRGDIPPGGGGGGGGGYRGGRGRGRAY